MKTLNTFLFIIITFQITFAQSISQEKLSDLTDQAKATSTEAVIVYHDGKIILEEYFGIGHPDTLIETMSCTKSIVGLAAACLLEDGYLDSLNTPVFHFYPEWNQGKKKLITVEHILTMTSGIQNHPNTGIEIYPSPDFVQLALTAELTENPGETFRYNNKSLNLMSGIILQITGKRMDKYIEDRLFKPLGIERYNWTLDDAGNPHVMSGCQVRPTDFIKFGILLLKNGAYQGQQIIKADNIKKIVKPISQNKGYGILWWLDYGGVKYTVDQGIISELKKKKTDSEFVQKMIKIKGEYTDYISFEKKIIEVFGEDPWSYIRSNISSFDDFRKKELTGKISNYRAEGYLGNYIIVLPHEKIVAVRMISYNSYNHKDESGKDGFSDFKTLVSNLIKTK